MTTARVTLFKPSGKYYTEEEWAVPADAVGPYDLGRSPDFRRIDGGAVLVDTQEPWGYPHLFPSSRRPLSIVAPTHEFEPFGTEGAFVDCCRHERVTDDARWITCCRHASDPIHGGGA